MPQYETQKSGKIMQVYTDRKENSVLSRRKDEDKKEWKRIKRENSNDKIFV